MARRMTGRHTRPRVAVVGAGISGLATAWHLADVADVTLLEADSHFGGHAHTVDVTLDGTTHGVDTGFLVFNHATYPHLRQLFADLGVDTAPSEMSFSVQVPRDDGRPGLEWSGCNLDTVFSQRRNLVNPRFLGMLRDLLRFNRITTQIAEAQQEAALQQPIGEFLVERAASRLRSATGTCCPCWAASGAAPPTRCCASRSPP